jgi:hypothetical protein
MQTRMSKTRRFILLGFILAGAILGALFIPKQISDNILLNAGAGAIIALFLSFIFFPELRKNYSEAWNGKETNLIKGETTKIELRLFFIHPVQQPMWFGIFWFLVFMGLMILLNLKVYDNGITLPGLIFLMPPVFLFGLSGFLMFKRKEEVSPFGQVYRGISPYFKGALIMIGCWGFCTYLLLATIFHWK